MTQVECRLGTRSTDARRAEHHPSPMGRMPCLPRLALRPLLRFNYLTVRSVCFQTKT